MSNSYEDNAFKFKNLYLYYIDHIKIINANINSYYNKRHTIL